MGRITYWTPLAFLAVFLCLLQMSAACTCSYEHPQYKFCQADFVVLVTVEEFKKVEGDFSNDEYKVHVNQTFKVKPSAQAAMEQTPLWIQTPSLESMCGVQGLTLGQTWVIGGYIIDGHPEVLSCNLAMLWSNVTPRQREGFEQLYQYGCVCRISFPSWLEKNDGKTCHGESSPGPQDCQTRFGICRFQSGACSWTSESAYNDCMTQYPNDLDQNQIVQMD